MRPDQPHPVSAITSETVRYDQPLRGHPHPHDRLHPGLYACEFAGTALLVFCGLSIVIAFWGKDAPLSRLPLPPGAIRALTGCLFGSVGALLAWSPLGKVSGAHINPAVTLGFWLARRIRWRDALGYVVAQSAGGIAGAAALLLWDGTGRSDYYGATAPAAALPLWIPLAGEMICGFALVLLIFLMVSHGATRRWTPLVNPPLFALLTWLEAPWSGASANPARSLGPAIVSGLWRGHWIYWIGPCGGAVLATALLHLGVFGSHKPPEARLFHFRHS